MIERRKFGPLELQSADCTGSGIVTLAQANENE